MSFEFLILIGVKVAFRALLMQFSVRLKTIMNTSPVVDKQQGIFACLCVYWSLKFEKGSWYYTSHWQSFNVGIV